MLSGPFRGRDALAAGLLTRDQLYGPRFLRVFPDVYLPRSGFELDLAGRSHAAYLLVSDREGVLGGYSAAALLGADCAPRNAPAEVILPGSARAHPGLRIQRATVEPDDLMFVDGCRVTGPSRTAWDLCRRLPLVEAVVAVDALARRGPFDPGALLVRRAKQPGVRGCRRLDGVVELADPRSESPPETRLRVGLLRYGLPPPEVQYLVADEYGHVLARVDLAYPEAKLAIEYDGSAHFEQRRAVLDRRRDAELADQGWLTLRLTHDDVVAIRQTAAKVTRLHAHRLPPRST